MIIRPERDKVRIWSPAKLNLFLEILARRQDGFHELEMLMTTIAIYDRLEFTPDGSGRIRLSCFWKPGYRVLGHDVSPEGRGTTLGDLPTGADNLVWQAIDLIRQNSGEKGSHLGARVSLVKGIPSGSGLGGASGNAAAALLAANECWQLGLPPKRLHELALRLGSDVPFFLTGGMAVCRGRGEIVQPVHDLPRLHFVVVRPPEGLSTPAVYRDCSPAENPASVYPLLSSLRRGDCRDLNHLVVNRLYAPASRLLPWIGRMSREFTDLNCPAHQMSGSGSSYYGLFYNARQARHVASRLRSRRIGTIWSVSSTPPGDNCR